MGFRGGEEGVRPTSGTVAVCSVWFFALTLAPILLCLGEGGAVRIGDAEGVYVCVCSRVWIVGSDMSRLF